MNTQDQSLALQTAKSIVRTYMDAFDTKPSLDVLQNHTSDDYTWRGLHPFHEQPDASAAFAAFWRPLIHSFTALQRREDVFLAGRNDCDGGKTIWTCSMGHFMGLLDQDWLGIPATGKIAMLPYAEFHRIEDGKIAETAMFCDILRVAAQAGVHPLPDQTGADLPNPPPLTHDGILLHDHDPAQSAKTQALVTRMGTSISAVNEIMQGKIPTTPPTPRDELSVNWHDHMGWYGPTGIGATYTIDRYIEQHQQPFRRKLSNRVFNGHIARIAEGNYCAFFGWPNLTMTPDGGFLGMPVSDTPADMRVTDVYRRDGEKLAENWVIIDMLHFLNMQGRDVLGEISAKP